MRKIGNASSAANCMLVGLDNEALGLVREALAAEAALPPRSIGFGEVQETMQESRPEVIIVGYSDAVDASIELAQDLTKNHPKITLIALADRADSAQILSAMRVGFKEFVVLPQDTERLREVVKSAANEAEEEGDKGTVIAMLGAKGGVGTTVLTTNICTELAMIHTVLCVDFDFGMGDVASLLDLKVRETLAELAPRADRLDERSLTASVSVHKSKVHVLPVPENMSMIGEASSEELYTILNIAAKGYHYVFVDCGTHLDEAVSLACQAADTIVLVTTPDITSVRDALRKLRMLQAIDVPKSRVRIVVNRYYKGSFVSLADIKENLGMPISATVADDPKTVEAAINDGKLLRDANKKSDVSRDISNLVAMLTTEAIGDVTDDPGGPGGGGGFFASLFGRG